MLLGILAALPVLFSIAQDPVAPDRSQQLLKAVESTNRIVVRSGGLCHRRPKEERTLAEVKDATLIQGLFAGLKVGPSMGHCMCCGNPTIEFYRDDALLAAVGFHHSQSLRWQGWPDDSILPLDRAEFLVNWLSDRGVPGLKEDFARFAAEMKAVDKMLARTMAGLPAHLKADLLNGPEKFEAALAAEFPKAPARIAALLRMLGAGNQVWRSHGGLDGLCSSLLKKEEETALRTAVADALSGSDRRLRRGAAKLWAFEKGFADEWMPDPMDRGLLTEWKPATIGALEAKVLDVRRDCFLAENREEGLRDLERWAGDLKPDDLDARIAEAMKDPAPDVRRRAMLAAGRLGVRAMAAQLVDILGGKAGPLAKEPDVPADEKEMDEMPEKMPGEDEERISLPGEDWEWAAIALGYLKHQAAHDAIVAKGAFGPHGAGKTAARTALALMGDTAEFSEACFSREACPLDLQVASIDAVIRLRGRVNLAWALTISNGFGGRNRSMPRIEALKKMLLAEKPPGAEELARAEKPDQLMAWFNAHGDAYLKQLK